MRGAHAMVYRHRHPARLAALALGLALAVTGGIVAPAAAQLPLDGTAPLASALGPSAAALPDPDCAGGDISAFEGFDNRCETWTAVYDDPEMYDDSLLRDASEWPAVDRVHQLVASPAGERVFTFGRSCLRVNPPVCRWAVVAHRAGSGDELWVAREWATGDIPVTLVGIAVSADGKRVYATGQVGAFGRYRGYYTREGDWRPLRNTGVLTIAWDAASGRKLWENIYSGEPIGHRQGDRHDLHSYDAGVALAADPASDRLYVTGYSDDRDDFYNVLVIAYDGVTGNRQWVVTDDTSTAERRYVDDRALPHLAQVSPGGETLYLAASNPSGVRLLAYQAHDPKNPAGEGTLRWSRELDSTPDSLDLAPDGSRIYLRTANRIAAYETVSGDQSWPFPPRYHDGDGTATDLAVSPTGDQIYVTGAIPGLNDDACLGEDVGQDCSHVDYGIIAYNAVTGQQTWLARYDGWSPDDERNDTATSVAVSPDGARVYVTGISTTAGAGASDTVTGQQVTVAYDATIGGEPRWGAAYSRLLDNEANGCSYTEYRISFDFRTYTPPGGCVAVGIDGTVFTASTLAGSLYGDNNTSGSIFEAATTRNIADWGVQAHAP